MENIYSKKEPWMILHIIHQKEDFSSERKDIVDGFHFIQVAALQLPAGRTFRPHKHILKETINGKVKAQESWVVISGKVKCLFYDIDDALIAERQLLPGDISITLTGGHNYEALEPDTLVYEYKTGPYEGQEKDKVFI